MTITEDKIDITVEWQAANSARSALYRWFADVFARELTPAIIEQWQDGHGYDNIHEVFLSLGLGQYSKRVKVAIDKDLALLTFSDKFEGLLSTTGLSIISETGGSGLKN